MKVLVVTLEEENAAGNISMIKPWFIMENFGFKL